MKKLIRTLVIVLAFSTFAPACLADGDPMPTCNPMAGPCLLNGR